MSSRLARCVFLAGTLAAVCTFVGISGPCLARSDDEPATDETAETWVPVTEPPPSRFSFGIRAGGGVGWLSYDAGTPEGFDRSGLFSYLFGADLKFAWLEKVSIESGLLFTRKGGVESGFVDEQLGNEPIRLDYETTTSLTYLVVPIRVKWKSPGSEPKPYVRAGGDIGLRFGAKRELEGVRRFHDGSTSEVRQSWDVQDAVRSVDPALAVDLGFQGPFFDDTQAFIELGIAYGLLDVSESDEDTIRNRTIDLVFGVEF